MNEFYIQRHFKLWEDNNQLLNRAVFLTVVISLTLVIKVLDPFVDLSKDRIPVSQAVELLHQEKSVATQKIRYIEKTAGVLEGVNSYIDKKPWQKEKRDLIERYRRMNSSTPEEGFSRERYQQEADDTINRIDEQLHENVISPLQQSIDGIKTDASRPEKLIGEIGSLNRFIEAWKNEYIGKNWYRTISRKDMTMRELTSDLNHQLRQLSNVVKIELATVKQAKFKVDKELSILTDKINTESKKLEKLDENLQKVLPEWLRGFIKIEQVIQLLPAVLLGSAIFVVFLGLSLTRHYKIYVDSKKIGSETINDPGMSSTWTLIHRGFTGTLLTSVAYVVFIVFSWALYERSVGLLLNWLATDPADVWVSSITFWDIFLWAGRAGFVVLLVFMATRLKSCSLPKQVSQS